VGVLPLPMDALPDFFSVVLLSPVDGLERVRELTSRATALKVCRASSVTPLPLYGPVVSPQRRQWSSSRKVTARRSGALWSRGGRGSCPEPTAHASVHGWTRAPSGPTATLPVCLTASCGRRLRFPMKRALVPSRK